MTAEKSSKSPLSRFLGVFRYSAVAMRIVWDTSAPLMIAMALTTLIVGLLPAAIASVGGLFVDAVAGALGSAGAAAECIRLHWSHQRFNCALNALVSRFHGAILYLLRLSCMTSLVIELRRTRSNSFNARVIA